MPRLTRRQWAIAHNSQAPLGANVPVPAKRAKARNLEWRLQCECVRICRQWMGVRKDFRFLAPQPEGQRDPKRAANAKAAGLQSGPADVWLMRCQRGVFQLLCVELKIGDNDLTYAQKDWRAWLSGAAVPVHRITTAADFATVLEEFLR